LILGLVFLALAGVGLPLPLFPAIPFLSLTVFFFGSSARRIHHRFLEHMVFDQALRRWQHEGTIERKSKYF